jgi:hypothetical protein
MVSEVTSPTNRPDMSTIPTAGTDFSCSSRNASSRQRLLFKVGMPLVMASATRASGPRSFSARRHHPTYGGVIFKSNRAALEAEIVELEKLIKIHKKTVLNRFDHDAKKSIEELVKAFWRDIARAPPQDLVDQLGTSKPSTDEAKAYLRYILAAAFPKADEVAESMRIMRVVKDVTWNTLNEPGFIDWLKEQFPHARTYRNLSSSITRRERR